MMSNHPMFLNVDTLTSQIIHTPSPPTDNAEMANPLKLQPSTLYSSKATETLLVRLLQKVQFNLQFVGLLMEMWGVSYLSVGK